MKDKKKIQFNLKNVIVLGILVILVVTFYIGTSHSSQTSVKSPSSEFEKIMGKDLETAYPATPKEVVKLYNRIVKCLYNTSLSDKKVAELTEKVRELFDQELLDENPLNQHIERLEEDIKTYKNEKRSIISYIAGDNDSVEYSTVDKVKYATILSDYTVKSGAVYEKSVEKFLLREDTEGRWKIVGWTLEKKEPLKKEE